MITVIPPPFNQTSQALEALECLVRIYPVRIEIATYRDRYGNPTWVIKCMGQKWQHHDFTVAAREASTFIFKAYEGQKEVIT